MLDACDGHGEGLGGGHRARRGGEAGIDVTWPGMGHYRCPRAEGGLTAKNGGGADHAGVIVKGEGGEVRQRDRLAAVLADRAESLGVAQYFGRDDLGRIGKRQAVCRGQRTVFGPEGEAVRGAELAEKTKPWQGLPDRLALRVDEPDRQADSRPVLLRRIAYDLKS
jgi:hypothetical protein